MNLEHCLPLRQIKAEHHTVLRAQPGACDQVAQGGDFLQHGRHSVLAKYWLRRRWIGNPQRERRRRKWRSQRNHATLALHPSKFARRPIAPELARLHPDRPISEPAVECSDDVLGSLETTLS